MLRAGEVALVGAFRDALLTMFGEYQLGCALSSLQGEAWICQCFTRAGGPRCLCSRTPQFA